MRRFEYDILLVGGGLVNGLLAWQLKHIKPWLKFLILERGTTLGGKHTWSFHEEDLSSEALRWIAPLISTSWPYYRVRFPDYERQLESRYHSIRSNKFHEVLVRELAQNVRFGSEAVAVSENQVVLKNGEIFTASRVVDGRGQLELETGTCGFQKFFGLEVELAHPHGLSAPVLMDATVEQVDGYRFLYCLPWNDNRLLVEDTRYSENPDLNPERLRSEVLKYCAAKNWHVKEVLYEESGCLPLPLTTHFVQGNRVPEELRETTLTIGMRAGLFHPTTGYSLPLAVRTVEHLLKTPNDADWSKALEEFRVKIFREQRFFIFLNQVMFRATSPESRYRFLQHFYQHSADLISRFYAFQLGPLEKARFFLRTPPVSMGAIYHALRRKVAYGF